MNEILCSGLGQIGLPVAEYIKGKGFSVIGYDKSREAAKKAQIKGIQTFLDWNKVPHSEVYVVCVGTGIKVETQIYVPFLKS